MSNEHVHPTILESLQGFIPKDAAEQAAIRADLQYNKDKNSGKLEREKVGKLHQDEVNLQDKIDPQTTGEHNDR